LNESFWLFFFFYREIDNARARVERGLKKLEETNVLVEEMQLELVALEPQLKKKSDETAKLMETLAIDQEKADEVEQIFKINFNIKIIFLIGTSCCYGR